MWWGSIKATVSHYRPGLYHMISHAKKPLYARRVSVLIVQSPNCREYIFLQSVSRITMASPTSSRKRGHSSRNSVSSTPARSTRTPKKPRQPTGSANPTPSPLFVQPSPSNGQRQNEKAIPSNLDVSSPVRFSSDAGDVETTPRAGGAAVGG